MMNRTFLAVAALLAVLSVSANAGLLVYEPFAYPGGWLTGQGGALGTTGTWTANDTHNGDWRIHQEGEIAGVVISSGPPVERNMFDGTVANLATSGGYVGLPGPEDVGRGENEDFEIARYMDASIGLDPSVTDTFRTGATTWFSYVAAHGWDRNEETPYLTIGTDPSPNQSRNSLYNLTNSGNGIGSGGGPPRGNRSGILPRYHRGGASYNLIGAATGWRDDAKTAPDATATMPWVARDADGDFGAPNIIVGKIEWDADAGGEDIITVVRFLETDELIEAEFDALVALKPDLSSANWTANKPNLDQSRFDTLNIAGTKFFVDEIRIATTFEEVVGGAGDPTVPEVDAGVDMVSWSGQAVQLDPNIFNNDTTPLTYAWSADPTDGVVFSATNVEAPTVTITKPALILNEISISNAGFESPALADGGYTNTPSGWTNGYYETTAPGVWVVSDVSAGGYNPHAASHGYRGVAPEGENVGFTASYVGQDGGLRQVLSATLQANTQYDLSVLVGNPFLFNGNTATADYRIELLAGGVVLASDTGASPLNDTTWTTANLIYDSGDSPAELGEALEIRLLAVDFTDGKGVDFDDVRLIAQGPPPDPYTVTLTLAVNNEGSGRPDKKSMMTIDVYDNACQAAEAVGQVIYDPGDVNRDCVTDAKDLAELAGKWLTYIGLTEPVLK